MVPTSWLPATDTIDPATVPANCAARSSMSTGGSVAIPVRSSATAAKSSAIAPASAGDAGRTVNCAVTAVARG
jgi:hypothetical protein